MTNSPLKFNCADYIGKTMHFSTEQHGAYVLILCSYWANQSPVKESELCRITKLGTHGWERNRNDLADMFRIRDGHWHDKDIDDQIKHEKNKSLRRKIARNKRIPKLRKKYGRITGSAWNKIRQAIFNRDGHKCVYCGNESEQLHCDHVLPLSKGGDNSDKNLATACKSCNLSKNDKLLEEWLGAKS